MEITRTQSRPLGISIIAVLLFIAAALDIVYGHTRDDESSNLCHSDWCRCDCAGFSVGLSHRGSSRLSRRLWPMGPPALGILDSGNPRNCESHLRCRPVV